MDDAVAAVESISADVGVRPVTIEIAAADWPPDPSDGWVGVGGVVLSPARDRVVLVRTHWSGEEWVVPGGGVEPTDPSLRAALRREVREETGLAVTVGTPLLVEDQTFVHATTDESFSGRFVVFRAFSEGTTLTDDPGENDDEIRAVRWFDDPPEGMEHAGVACRCLDA